MRIYTIGDLHLSLTTNKPMDIFGGNWANHTQKLKENWENLVTDEDVVVLAGDISWGMNFDEALADFRLIESLPGKKLIIKGNHDYYFSTVNKMTGLFEKNNITSIEFLHNRAFLFGDCALCGTKGWFVDEDKGEHHEKIFKREVIRLENSLKEGERMGGKDLIVFLHYPPVYANYECNEILEVMNNYGVKRCYYGHLHGTAREKGVQGLYKNIDFHLVSCDNINFTPKLVTKL